MHRYGLQGTLADFGQRKLVPCADLIEELIGLLRDHARNLGSLAQLERAREILRDGTSADHQLRVYHAALEAGASEHEGAGKGRRLARRGLARGRLRLN
jgi:glutamate---cysteine ligase / carboxylate-amine ligase